MTSVKCLPGCACGRHTAWNKGVPQTEEQRKRNSESHKGIRQNQESIEKRVLANTGKKREGIALANISNASNSGRFVKGAISWSKGKKCPTISASIDKEQRRKQLLERWENDPDYAAKARKALVDNPPSYDQNWKDNLSAAHKTRMLTHPEDCECPMHRHYQTPEGIENMATFFRGRKLTEEHKEKIFSTLDSHEEDCKCGWHNLAHIETKLEKILYKFLQPFFPTFVKKKRFGSKEVDIYVPYPHHLAFEADGEHWHKDKEKDANRDKYLLDKFSLLVIRVPEIEILAIEKLL